MGWHIDHTQKQSLTLQVSGKKRERMREFMLSFIKMCIVNCVCVCVDRLATESGTVLGGRFGLFYDVVGAVSGRHGSVRRGNVVFVKITIFQTDIWYNIQ